MYLLSIIIGIFASIICAVSNNVAMLVVFRAIQAGGTCASQTLGKVIRGSRNKIHTILHYAFDCIKIGE